MGRVREEKRREEKKREDQRRERVRGKKMQVHQKVEKSRNTAFFQWFVAPEGQKGSLKRRVRSHLAKWKMKNCTTSWRQAHFEVKMCKVHQRRTAFGGWDVEKLHPIVARSTFGNQNVQSTPTSDHFWKLRCRKGACRCGAKHISKSNVLKTDGLGAFFGSWHVEKVHAVMARSTFRSQNVQSTPRSEQFWKLSWDAQKVHAVVARSTFRSQHVQSTPRSEQFWKLRCSKSARCCGAKHISKSTCAKHFSLWALFEVEMSKECTLWREAHFEVNSVKNWRSDGPLLDVQMWFCVAGARDSVPCRKWVKREVFCRISQNDGRRGTFEEDLERCIFRGRRSTGDMFIRDVRRSGRWFPERGCILEHQIVRFAKMILRDRCSPLYDLASIFLAGAVL